MQLVLTGSIGKSGSLGGRNSLLLDPKVGLGDGIMGVLYIIGFSWVASPTRRASGLGLGCSLLLTLIKALRNRGRRNGIEAAIIPVFCST